MAEVPGACRDTGCSGQDLGSRMGLPGLVPLSLGSVQVAASLCLHAGHEAVEGFTAVGRG